MRIPSLRSFGLALNMVRKAGGWRAAVLAVFVVIDSITYPLAAYMFGQLLDKALRQEAVAAIYTGLVIGVLYGVNACAGWLNAHLALRVQEEVNLLVDTRLLDVVTGLPQLSHFEQAKMADQIAILRSERGAVGRAIQAMVITGRLSLMIVFTIFLLAQVNWAFAMLPLSGIGLMVARRKAEKERQRSLEAMAEKSRLASKYFDLSTDYRAAGEIRTSQLGNELRERYGHLQREIDATDSRVAKRAVMFDAVGWLSFVAAYGVIIIFSMQSTASVNIVPGEILMVILLAGQMHMFLHFASSHLRTFTRLLATFERLLWLSELYTKDRAQRRGYDSGQELSSLSAGIALQGVTFKYPDTDRIILRDISIELPLGKSVAIVGSNGVGKTTLIKLLCGFYQPTQGAIWVNGSELATYDHHSWWSRLAVCFQDFARFELRLLNSVGIGELSKINDRSAVGKALKQAEAEQLVANLPGGLDSQLGATWPGGVDLSTGQWQKVAISRTLMRRGVALQILDEPTANVDAVAEHALFNHFHRMTEESRVNNGITLILSHRFSTVRMADLILVLNEGTIAEFGSHAELMSAHGIYRELFTKQAATYE